MGVNVPLLNPGRQPSTAAPAGQPTGQKKGCKFHTMDQRTYETTHPWLTFTLNLADLTPPTWMQLGEALSKCDHISGAPIPPAAAQELNLVYLSKGIYATTSIEGNTLSEPEVVQRVQGQLPLPKSLEYQGEEIDNLLQVLNTIRSDFEGGDSQPLTVEKIKSFNALILANQPVDDAVQPGRFRTHSVVVGDVYRGAPAEDLDYLMDRFVTFINEDLTTNDPAYERPVAILRAIVAHLYLAWIHPFGDGNGRTARLVETHLLFEAGVPSPAAHVLSDFYNRTRSKYYAKLKNASRSSDLKKGLTEFIEYAVEGFADGLREQVACIEGHQLEIAWTSYIHEVFEEAPRTEAQSRRRRLALTMPYVPPGEEGIPKAKIPELSIDLARDYVVASPKTLTRDVNALVHQGLIVKRGKGYSSNRQMMAAFLPVVSV